VKHSAKPPLKVRWIAALLEFVPLLAPLAASAVEEMRGAVLLAIALVITPDLGWLLLRRTTPALLGSLVRAVALVVVVATTFGVSDCNVGSQGDCPSPSTNFYYLAGIASFVGWSILSAAVILLDPARLRIAWHRLRRVDDTR